LCTARRAIKTSYQQSDYWILIDTRFYIRHGNWALPGRRQSRRKEPSTDLNESKTTIKQEERIMMKPSTDDKTAGKLHEVKGAIKQKVGELSNNPNLAADGRAEKNAGKVQNVVGKIEKAAGK
jgi:uncharacterized protein YjbJ (UPF0337 family)